MLHLKNTQEFFSSKLFEAFDSSKLSKIIRYINDRESKNKFLDLLKKVTDSLDFPMSNLSDDYFQYLPYRKALSLTVDSSELQDCTASSQDSYPDHSVPDNFCESGYVLRTWGKGVRKAPCLRCSGTGKLKNSGIKWLKFWFNQNGEFTCWTGTDGTKIEGIDKYKEKAINHRELRGLPTGTKVKIQIRGRWLTATIYQHSGNTFAIHDEPVCSGGFSGQDWKRYGRYSWNVSGIREYGECFVLSKLPLDSNDPILLNKEVTMEYGKILLSDNFDDRELNKSHFALILDFGKLRELTFKKKSEIKKERELSKSGSISFISDEEIKRQNFHRYLTQIFNKSKLSTDISDISKFMVRIMGGKYLGFHIFDSNKIRPLNNFIELVFHYINASELFLQDENNFDNKKAVEDLEKAILVYVKSTTSNMYEDNSVIDKKIKELRTSLVQSKNSVGIKVLDLILNLNNKIFEKFKNYEYETLEDLLLVQSKYKLVKEHFLNPRFKIAHLLDFMFVLSEESFSKILNQNSFSDIVMKLERLESFLRRL